MSSSTFRSVSNNSNFSLNSLSASITRVALGPMASLSLNFNKQSIALDHLNHQCSILKHKLQELEGMQPFLNLAFNSAEQCAEQQALALSQQMQHDNSRSANDYRASVGSTGFSIHSDSSNTSTVQAPTNLNKLLSTNNIFTFTAGVLPANISVDPATQLWKLFQQGAPLCLIFNILVPEHHIPVVGSDDLRICKKSVYDFLIAVQTHLQFEDEIMFTISNVFLDNTQDLMKILVVVNKLLATHEANVTSASRVTAAADKERNTPKLPKVPGAKIGSSEDRRIPSDRKVPSERNSPTPEPFKFPELDHPDIVITDDRSRVFKEIVETERKYVQDLELLAEYKAEISNAELISSEQIHVLFPNLNEIIDFQRRFLNGLECNINVPNKYQRIGLIFMHAASGPFKAYEPWTIGQLAAIDLITKELANLRKSSTLLDPGFELQSYIIKPIQRLCKYPLLLKELIKTSPENPPLASYHELIVANTAMKELANQVNEAQRRAENVEYLYKLIERVSNWRGFNLKDQGELLHHGHVGVRDAENEKEYVAYLFERIVFFFVELDKSDPKEKDTKKKREILLTRKKLNSSVNLSSTNLAELSDKTTSPLELKGRVYILEIYNISSSNTNGYTLVISWSGKKESGSFTLRYRAEETRNQWENCLRVLKTSEMNVQMHRKLRDDEPSNGGSPVYSPSAPPTATISAASITVPSSATSSNSTTSNFSPASAISGMSMGPADNSSVRLLNGSNYQRHHSSSSTFSMMRNARKSASGATEASSRALSNGAFPHPAQHALHVNPLGELFDAIKIKLIYNTAEIGNLLVVTLNIQYGELYQKISQHIAASHYSSNTSDFAVNKLKYKDEDGDFVVMDLNDDWILAIDMLDELEQGSVERHDLTIWVS